MEEINQIVFEKQINPIFYTSTKSFPILGLCKLNFHDGLFIFKSNSNSLGKRTYKVYELTQREKAICLLKKLFFEICVGKHKTFPFPKYKEKKSFISKLIYKFYYKVNWRI